MDIKRILWYGGVLFLLISVLWSGYEYQYNGDELIHAQNAYFLTTGMKPFGDYMSIYTPVFHWLIAPTILIWGKTLLTLHIMRVEMIGLFLIELLFSFALLTRLFGKRVAILFLGLILLDPFTTFAGMQIRPDTLMLTLFVAGLWAMTADRDMLAGLLFGLSALTAIKILPAMFPVCIVLLYKRKYTSIIAACMPWVIFIGYFASMGLVVPMVQQLTVDIKYLSDAVQNPTRFGFFYLPDNVYVYGVMGKPLTWWYVFLLPVLAIGGVFVRVKGRHHLLEIALVISMFLTFVGLLIPTTAFIQYYVPLSWFFCVFSAVLLIRIWDLLVSWLKPVALIGAICMYLLFVQSAFVANIARAQMTSVPMEQQLMTRWKQVPPTEPVFPNYLFRPAVYPIAVYQMGDVPPVIRQQFVKPEQELEAHHVKYILLDEPGLTTYDPSTQAYIRSRYQRVAGDRDLMIRNQ